MTPVVHTVTEQASIATVCRIMTKHHVHRIIVRKGKTISGIISALDLLNAVTKSVDKKNAEKKASRKKTKTKNRS